MSTLARPLALALAVVAMLLAACDGDRPSATTAPAAAPAGDLLEQVKAAKKVRIGVKDDTPPFGMKAGRGYTGFDVDIATAVVKQLGEDLKTDLDIEFVPVHSADRAKRLLNGDVDMLCASMTMTRYREREGTLDFTIPYFQDGQGLLVKKDSPVQSYLDLTGKNVGCVKGSTSSYYITQVNPDARPVRFADFPAMMEGLANGQVDAVTSDMIILMGLQKNAGDPAAYRIAGDRFTTEPYGIALRENQSRFRKALNAALMELWEDHHWQVIRDSWFGPGSRYETTINFAITPIPR